MLFDPCSKASQRASKRKAARAGLSPVLLRGLPPLPARARRIPACNSPRKLPPQAPMCGRRAPDGQGVTYKLSDQMKGHSPP